MPVSYIHTQRHACKCHAIVEARAVIRGFRVNADQNQDGQYEQHNLCPRRRDQTILNDQSESVLNISNQGTQKASNDHVKEPMHTAVQAAQYDGHRVDVGPKLEGQVHART